MGDSEKELQNPSEATSEVGIEQENATVPATSQSDYQWRALLEKQNENMRALIQALTPKTNKIVTLAEFDPNKPDSDAQSWCATVDLCLAENPPSGIDLILVISKALRGSASTWLSQISYPGITWTQLRDLFAARFITPETSAAILINLQHEKPQEGESISAFASRLMASLTNKWKNLSFEQIAVSTVLAHIMQFEPRLQRLAFTTEITSRQQLQNELQAFKYLKRKTNQPNDAVGSVSDSKRTKTIAKTPIKCYVCGKLGHKQSECYHKGKPKPSPSTITSRGTFQPQPSSSIVCFKCGGAGHIASRCPGTVAKDGAGSAPRAERRVDLCVVSPPSGVLKHQDWLTVTWQSGMPMQLAADEDVDDSVKTRCGRAGSFAATPGEKLLELLRPGNSTPRRHSTAACASGPPSRSSAFVYCPSDALPYCPPSRLVPPPRPFSKVPPPQIQMNQPPPVPQRIVPVLIPSPVPQPPPRKPTPKPPKRNPPPTPPRPIQTDSNRNKKQTIQNLPRLDCNKNSQPAPPRRLPQKPLPDSPFSPPPIPNLTQMKQSPSSSSNISTRQDSNVSSDSFSQTSSPSYNTKTMEAPLLPNQHLNKSLNAKIAKSLMIKEQQEKDGNSAITKSLSTPASLQTIVRLQNGSNMSLHHRMLRDIKGSGTQTSSKRFRLLQLGLNLLMLIMISGGFYAYTIANPKVEYVSQIINQTSIIETWRPITESTAARNPAPGVCLPIIVTFCHHHNITYNFTIFPNYVGHFGQRDAQTDLEVYDAVVDVRCYELTALFFCSLFVPKCGPLGHMVRPCRSLCQETMRRCGFFLEVFGLSMPDYIQCDIFPESTDTDVCLGNREVRESKQRATKPMCQSGFLCDVHRCIPLDWRCDGHVDCLDRSDEMNCRICRNSADVYCGNSKCISTNHLCDGKVDCPRGQDEKNCLRLSESNGDIGHGELQLYRASNNSWYPACLRELDTTTAKNICSMMGYSWLNSSRLQLNVERAGLRLTQGGAAQKYREFKRNENGLLGQLNECDANAGHVQLVCHKYECGRRRISSGSGTKKRIVGGVQASPGDWPFLAAILGGPEEVFYCAGVLVADQWVLTASHCVGNHSDVSGWTIQLGISRRRAHAHYGQKVKVQRVVPHPRYSIGVAHDNDVALLQLAERVRYHEHLSPVCLPPADRVMEAGTKCMVIGWGKRDDKDKYEPAVNEVEVPVLNRELCNEWLEHRDLNITEGMICAGYPEGGKDACQGDSGGPLLCRDKRNRHRWYVGGIVSWGIKCAHPRLPGVYAYVPKYIPWILQQISLYDSEHARTHGDYTDY